MLIYLIIALVILIVVILLFSSPKLSPIPYFPSQKIDLPKIVQALDLENNQTVFDLGAGDGIVIFKAAEESLRRKLNTKFIAVEINPILILILHVRRLFHQNRNNIFIVQDDIFKINIKNQIAKIPLRSRSEASKTTSQKSKITIYLYISPWFLEKIIENCLSAEAPAKLKFVSYMYPIKSLKSKEKIIQGKNKIFIYNK